MKNKQNITRKREEENFELTVKLVMLASIKINEMRDFNNTIGKNEIIFCP